MSVGKPEGKKSHGKYMHRWEDNIKMDWKEIGCCVGPDSYDSGLVSAVDCCEHKNEPSGSI
jgi:hypothetical protein